MLLSRTRVSSLANRPSRSRDHARLPFGLRGEYGEQGYSKRRKLKSLLGIYYEGEPRKRRIESQVFDHDLFQRTVPGRGQNPVLSRSVDQIDELFPGFPKPHGGVLCLVRIGLGRDCAHDWAKASSSTCALSAVDGR
jgi:hypothetical protein